MFKSRKKVHYGAFRLPKTIYWVHFATFSVIFGFSPCYSWTQVSYNCIPMFNKIRNLHSSLFVHVLLSP